MGSLTVARWWMHQLKRASSEGCGDVFRRGARRVALCACANRNTTLGENRGEQSSDFANRGEAGAGHFSPKKRVAKICRKSPRRCWDIPSPSVTGGSGGPTTEPSTTKERPRNLEKHQGLMVTGGGFVLLYTYSFLVPSGG